MKKISREDFLAGCIVGGSIIGMVLAFMITLADVVSKPGVHTASYAVRHSSPSCFNPAISDQECVTLVSLSGLAPGHLLTEVTR